MVKKLQLHLGMKGSLGTAESILAFVMISRNAQLKEILGKRVLFHWINQM